MSFATALKNLFAKPYGTVRPDEASELLDSRRAILIDVREQHEWRAGHAPKARHIPLGSLPGRVRELPAGRPLVTVCRSGRRSARAAAMLAKQGHEVFNLTGGMAAWARSGLPVQARSGPGQII